MSTERANVRSIERAVAVLEFLACRERPVLLHEISAAIGAPKSTALNIMRTLAARRLVNVDGVTRAYTLGSWLGEVASRTRANPEIRAIARPHLERLARDTDEGAFLSVLEGDGVVYLDKVESVQDLRFAVRLGARRPLHCTAAGKLALAMSTADVVDRYVASGLPRHTSATCTDPGEMRRELAVIRRRGYAVSRGEYVSGLFGLAAPVIGAAGELVAIVTVGGPLFRTRGRLRGLRDALLSAGRQVSLDYVRATGGG
jgi:DNA-binding IclR family transcriptional regulator